MKRGAAGGQLQISVCEELSPGNVKALFVLPEERARVFLTFSHEECEVWCA